jgi:glyoxylase-like metal-dependent hydrolase (beta-lactamase superfamily II)
MKGLRDMPRLTKQPVRSLHYYNCGHCVNRLGFAYRGYSFKKHLFPSGVFLIKHTKGYVLFDTGYSTDIYKTGAKGRLYRTLNPTHVHKDEEIVNQLRRDGIRADDITYIIVSHLHPDHIGGLKAFPKSKLIISKDALQTLRNPSFTDLIFSSLLPRQFDSQVMELESMGLKHRSVKSLKGYDLFGDGTIVIGHLDGHSHGHLGAFIANKILLAGDACWGGDLLEASKNMRLPIKLIHRNQTGFLDTIDLLLKLQKKGVKLCFSHDDYTQKELL